MHTISTDSRSVTYHIDTACPIDSRYHDQKLVRLLSTLNLLL